MPQQLIVKPILLDFGISPTVCITLQSHELNVGMVTCGLTSRSE